MSTENAGVQETTTVAPRQRGRGPASAGKQPQQTNAPAQEAGHDAPAAAESGEETVVIPASTPTSSASGDPALGHATGHGAMSAGGVAPGGGNYDVGFDGDYADGAPGGYPDDYGYDGTPQEMHGRGGYGSGSQRRYNQGSERKYPSNYQVREISSRGMPVPPTYDQAQALLDSFPPTQPQQKRLDELGLQAETRGEAKHVIARYVDQNPDVAKRWEAENAQAAVARRQGRREQYDPRVTSPGMFKILADAGVTNIPSDHATASAMIDALPPSDGMIRLLQQNGRTAPATRAEAQEIIRGLPATPDQVQTIMARTRGRYWPQTRGEAERWFNENPRPNSGGYGRGGYGGQQRGYGGGYQQAA